MPAAFGYWNLRGLGQFIRFLLEYTGTEYNEKLYSWGGPPDYDRSGWLKKKNELGLDFPNLPYYIDGDVKLTQSIAILKYIGEKNNMAGKTPEEKRTLSMLECEGYDLRIRYALVCYDPKFEESKKTFLDEFVPPKLEQYSKFLGNRQWFVGDRITYIDFLMYESLYVIKELSPSSFDKFETLTQFLSRIESLEPIKKYMNSSRYIKNPINAPTAYYGGS